MRRKFMLAIVGASAALLGGLLGASPAAAHNTFVDSSPRDREVLVAAPTTWVVTFAKSVPLESASASVIDGSGARFALSAPTYGDSDRTVVFSLPPDLNGAVSARWRLVGTDGHVISGRVAFTIQIDPTATAPSPGSAAVDTFDESGTPDAVRVALRFANFAAIVLLGGLMFTEIDIAAGALMTRRGRKVATWAAGFLVANPIAQFLVFADDVGAGGASFTSAMSDAVSMTAGSMLSVRILAGLVLGWFVVTCLRQAGAERLLKVPIGVVSVAYLVSLAYGGHSRSESAPWLGIPVDVVHTAAIAVWLGGLIMLVIIVVPSVSASEAVAAFSRFSGVAQRAVVIIALTGVIQMMRIHGNPVEVFSSTHGLVLVAKVVLVAIMIRLALRNRATLQRHTTASLANSERSRDLLLRATTTEVLFGFGVLGLTAVLVAVTPG